MKISGLNSYNPIFMAHTYEICHKDPRVVIQTDNEKDLGNEPYLCYEGNECEMSKEGDLYQADVFSTAPDFKYHIVYKDTGKVDLNNGKEYQINLRKMWQKVTYDSRIMHKQPLIQTIKEGKTIGRVMYDDDGFSACGRNLPKLDEPTILITPNFDKKRLDPNLVGIIYTEYDYGTFSHATTRLRQQTDVCGAVFEPKLVEKLISLDGKNIELELTDGNINFKETDRKGKPKTYPKIDVPRLKPCNKILTSKEYSSDIIGAKAVNLRRLEELKEQGKIDVIIPKSIALPHGYIHEMFEENPIQEKNYNKYKKRGDVYYPHKEAAYIYYKEEYCKERMDKLTKALFYNGIIKDKKDDVMVRSAFNGEDLPNCSAAGVYLTMPGNIEDVDEFYYSILAVAKSKWEDKALTFREMHDIPEENIQYGVLLQQRVRPDYKFTLYTDDDKGNLKIDLYSDIVSGFEDYYSPHTYTYNKTTGKLTYDSIQLIDSVGKFNENQELERIEPVQTDLSGNKKLFEQLKKVAENAVVVEKEFGHPQDIEGGIKGDDIYFWQSRNIVTN